MLFWVKKHQRAFCIFCQGLGVGGHRPLACNLVRAEGRQSTICEPTQEGTVGTAGVPGAACAGLQAPEGNFSAKQPACAQGEKRRQVGNLVYHPHYLFIFAF